jgi:hypothetical protein
MITLATLRKVIFAILLSVPIILRAQIEKPVKTKPYRILSSGKQITVKSTRDIKSLMVWTASGHRIIEQKELNASSYNFRIAVNEKYFFMMVQLVDGKVYTEKFGIP